MEHFIRANEQMTNPFIFLFSIERILMAILITETDGNVTDRKVRNSIALSSTKICSFGLEYDTMNPGWVFLYATEDTLFSLFCSDQALFAAVLNSLLF